MRTSLVFRQHIWLVETIHRSGGITFEELNRRWVNCYLSEGKPMPRSTFNYNRTLIEEIFGITILCSKSRGNIYYIESMRPVQGNMLQRWLMETISIGNLLADGKTMLGSSILPDEIPVGGYILSEIMRAMRQGVRIRITYRKFASAEGKQVEGSPLCLKASKRRWYCLLSTPDHDEPAVYSLDRIQDIRLLDEPLSVPTGFSAADFFRDSFGVYAGRRFPTERIVLRVSGVERDYLRTLPLHTSQRETERGSEWSLFEYRLRPTYDFMQEILSRGASIEVVEPAHFRAEVREEIKRMAAAYDEAPQ